MTQVSISKSKLIATNTIYAVHNELHKSIKMMGTLLGYPQCCINNHLKYTKIGNQDQRCDTSLITYDSYKSSKELSFYCNNLLNFSTRIDEKNIVNNNKYSLLNKNLTIFPQYYQYISHIPCCYDCQDSIRIGKEIEELLIKYAPKVQKSIQYTLSKPILFFDLFNLFIFEGHLNKGVLYYRKILPPHFLINPTLLKAINKGNKIVIDVKNVKIFRDDSPIYVYKKKNERDGFILDFNNKYI